MKFNGGILTKTSVIDDHPFLMQSIHPLIGRGTYSKLSPCASLFHARSIFPFPPAQFGGGGYSSYQIEREQSEET